jgi:putative methyltransferase (TIGR04325 family)
MSLSAALSRLNLSTLPWYTELRRTGFLDFVVGKELGHFRGRFPTRERAVNSVPQTQRATYDNEALVSIGIESYSTINPFDWPILVFCQKLIRENHLHAVTDFGGHVGVKFYAFKDMLSLPDDFRWQIVDVPAMVREGRRRLSPEVHSLSFFEHLEETEACDALLCSGVLQYVDSSIEEIIRRLPQRPYMIFLNKVPVSSKEGFFTVETFVKSLPYRIFGPDDLGNARQLLGYKLAASWPIPDRDIVVLSAKGMEKVQMVGEAWMLEQEPPKEARVPRIH